MFKSKKIILSLIVLVLSIFVISTNLQVDVQATGESVQTTSVTTKTNNGKNKKENTTETKIVGVPTIKFDANGNVSGTIKNVQDKKSVLNKFLSEYRVIITFLSGIGSLSMILFFILNFIELGNSKGNPQARQKAIHGLILSGVATAGLGSVVMITTLFYNMFDISNN